MPDILISEKMTGPALEQLRRDFDVAYEPDLWRDSQQLAERLKGVKALIVRNQTQATSELIAASGELLIVARAGVGLDNIDVASASKCGVVVTYTPRENSLSVAELTIGLMLSLARRIAAADRRVKEGGWDRENYYGIELSGKTLGVVGFGRIGVMVAQRARAFGMRILTYDPFLSAKSPLLEENEASLMELEPLLGESDFVACHAPSTDNTREMFDYERFSQMKKNAYFVNVARGDLVVEADLIRALEEKKLSGAALDVRQPEPPGDSALHQCDQVVLTPHIGAFTFEGQQRVLAAVCADVSAILRGEAVENFANFERPKKS